MPKDDQPKRIIAVDFDATWAKYDGWKGVDNLGKPIPEMTAKIKEALESGAEVVIFTARVNPTNHTSDALMDATASYLAIATWCHDVLGRILPITHEKSQLFTEIWDDRARQVIPNTGLFITELMDSLDAK